MWSSHPNFLDIVKGAWNTPINGSKMYCVVRKLKLLKKELMKLNKENYGDIEMRFHKMKYELTKIQVKLHKDNCNTQRAAK